MRLEKGDRFWSIELDATGVGLTMTSGPLGARGRSTTRSFASAADAAAAREKAVAAKLADGFAAVDEGAFDGGAEGRAQLAALEVAPRARVDAEKTFRLVHAAFTARQKSQLEHALVRAPKYKDLLKGVLRAYSFERMPATLDPGVEATSLLLVPTEAETTTRIIDYWVARAGLPFALEAFAQSLGPVSDHCDALMTRAPGRGVEGRWSVRADRVLRGALLAAADDERAAARAKAVALREAGDLYVRSALASIFLEPAWIDADLEERVAQSVAKGSAMSASGVVARPGVGPGAMFTELALLNASSPAKVAEFFAGMDPSEAEFLGPAQGAWQRKRGPWSAALIARFHADAVAPLAAWLERTAPWVGFRHRDPDTSRLLALGDLLGHLQRVRNSEDVTRAAVAVLISARGARLPKSLDPRPVATQCLRNSPAHALPLIRHAAKDRDNVWAKYLIPEIEDLANAARGAGADATTGVAGFAADTAALPPPLNAPAVFARPDFWAPTAFAPVRTAAGDPLPPQAIDALGALLAKGDPRLRALAVDRASLAAFAWDVLTAWLSVGAPPKHKWALTSLGLAGNDGTARLLGPLVRAWPRDSAHQRALWGLDALAAMDTAAALFELDTTADRARFGALADEARVRFESIATQRGLRADELSDRVVPARGDDALVADQRARLERAMVRERRWPAGDFRAYVVEHPVIGRIARGLVWAVYGPSDEVLATFRIAEAGFEDARGRALEPPPGPIGVVHRLALSDDDAFAWAGAGLRQPFEQLARAVYRLTDAERGATALVRYRDRVVSTRSLLALRSRGWLRGHVYDNGIVEYFARPIGRGLDVALRFDPGLSVGAPEYTDPHQTLELVDVGSGPADRGRVRQGARPLGDAPAIAISEVLRDLESLARAPRATDE